MELMSNFKGYGVLITYVGDRYVSFREGDEYESVEEFVHDIKTSIDIDGYKFGGIKETRSFQRGNYKLILLQQSGYKMEIYFKLTLGFKREVAKAIEDMV